MDVSHIVERINDLFNVKSKEIYSSESGVTYNAATLRISYLCSFNGLL